MRPTWFLTMPVVALLISSGAYGQLVGTRDLTSTPTDKPAASAQAPASNSHTSEDSERNCFITHRDGAVVGETREKLRLKIVSAYPRLVYDKAAIFITVQLENAGDQPVLVPWQTTHVEPVRTDSKDETSYESAMIHLTLGTQEKRDHGTILKGEAVLEALPDNYDQHIQLLPGQWIQVKFKALVECLNNEYGACSAFRADQHARLVAHWWEWLFTHQGEACNVVTGAYKSRMIDSDPLEIVFVSSPPQDQETPKH